MVYSVIVFDGDFQTNYWCKPCNAYMKEYSEDFEDGILPGELWGEPHYEKFKINYLNNKV